MWANLATEIETDLGRSASNGRYACATTESSNVENDPVDRESLKKDIQDHLEAIGFDADSIEDAATKSSIRHFHRFHRRAARERIIRAVGGKREHFLECVANGEEVNPANVRPKLIVARSGSRTGDLFRLATLLWSIPVSQGYGRRIRYLVMDESNNKLIGLFALGDPVFNLRVRDEWIGWDQANRRERLVNVMDAYVVGAVPPYAELLGGKLVTSLIASKEVYNEFLTRYGAVTGNISGRRKNARLSLVTVTSALGRSSIYNRLKLVENTGYKSAEPVVALRKLGTTVGYGHFQISDELFGRLRTVLQEDDHRYADGHQFGNGPNWRMRVVRTGLQTLGLNPDKILKHGIKREVYAMPIARNSREFLAGTDHELDFDLRTVDEIAELARQRWTIPRSRKRKGYKNFNKEQLDSLLFENYEKITER